MKKTLKRLALLSVAMLLAFAGCEDDFGPEHDRGNNGGGGATTGTINGHTWVDLGLPSGTKWATCNIGATTPEGYGNYYAWGETSPKAMYSYDNSLTYGRTIVDISGNPTYDAATANWGGSWRMPTGEEMEELIDNCTWTWTTQNGVNGKKVTGSNGNSIFLPAAGCIRASSRDYVGEYIYSWSSTPNNTDDAFSFRCNGSYQSVHSQLRGRGQTIRPVTD